LYWYLELSSDKSTEIKTPFLGLAPCNTDTTLLLLFTFYNQELWENFGILWRWDFSDGQFKFAGI